MAPDKEKERFKGETSPPLRSGQPIPPGEQAPPDEHAGGEGKTAHKPTKHDVEVELEQVKSALEAAETRSAEYLDSLKRMKAEFENYRKRMLREQSSFLELANAELVEKLIPVLDDLELALHHAGDDAGDGLAQGVRLVYEKFAQTLRKEGLEEINPEGAPFDPQVSEAMMSVPSAEHEDCTVLEVLKKGYKWRGKLIRPAMVTVSHCPAN